MANLDKLSNHNIQLLKEKGQYRKVNDIYRGNNCYLVEGGRRYISFCCNDYFGLSKHPRLINAAKEALDKYGMGAGASRLVTGNNPIYSKLETKLANIKNTEKAVIFGSGYLANIGTIPALCSRGDLIIADKLVHSSIIDGIKLSGADFKRFKHNDTKSCISILDKERAKYKNCLIITETIFSMDGDIAPLVELYDIADNYNAWLMTDDAHGFGFLAKDINKQPHIQIGTLSKAVGAYGGYVCASKSVIDNITNMARSLIYSTALPPLVIAAALEGLDIIESDSSLAQKALDNAKYFTHQLGIKEAKSQIVPLIIGDSKEASVISRKLKEQGFLVSAIRPPTVPKNTARLRFTFSALHKKEDINRLVGLLKS